MYWVIQNNLFNEDANVKLVDLLNRYNMKYELVKVIPFGGGIEPAIQFEPNDPVVVIGSMSLVKYAKSMNWTPGAWFNDNFSYVEYVKHHKEHMLNHNMKVISFGEIPNFIDAFESHIFMRPTADGKEFAGTVFNKKDLMEWYDKIMVGDSMWSITKDTQVMLTEPLDIYAEYRFIVVEGKIVTGSLYKRGNVVIYSNIISDDIINYAKQRAAEWTPDSVCVMDICYDSAGYHIVEFNNFNSAGLYECDISKIIGSITHFVEKFY